MQLLKMAIQSHLGFGIDCLRLSFAAEVDSNLENWGIDLLKTAELLNSDFHLKWDEIIDDAGNRFA